MNEYIVLDKAPTKEDYFRAKLYGIPFLIKSEYDIFKFDLIDFENECPCRIRHHDGWFYISDIRFKNDISIWKDNNLAPHLGFNVSDDCLLQCHPDIHRKLVLISKRQRAEMDAQILEMKRCILKMNT